MSNNQLITTTSNYQFLAESYKKARKALILETGTGIEIESRLKGVGLEGGTRSGKTWDGCVFLCEYVNTFTGKTIVVGRDNLTKLKKTVYETLKKIWRIFGMPMKVFNKSATPISYNGNTIFFVGLNDDIMLAHGLESDLLWVNETMGIAKDTADQLEQRNTEFFWYDYNPSALSSWLFDLELREDYALHKTTLLDNKYAPRNARAKVLGYEPTHPDDRHLPVGQRRSHPVNWERGTADAYMWSVYGLGNRAKPEHLIFKDYKIFDDFPKDVDWRYFGGDFGFTGDPNVMVDVARKGRNIYIKEVFRETEMTDDELVARIKKSNGSNVLGVWDSAEQKSIRYLQANRCRVVAANKPPDSKHYGIKKLQDSIIHVHRDSTEVHKELNEYRWKKLKNGEFAKNTFGHKIPHDGNDHALDAVRYVDTYFDLMSSSENN